MFANTWFTIDQRRLVNPPQTLWRVEHSGNLLGASFNNWGDLSYMKELHANWKNRTPTPFLSTFSNYRHAENWATHRYDVMGDRCVQIHEIDTNGLLVFGAGGDECLILDEVPHKNVLLTPDLCPQCEYRLSSPPACDSGKCLTQRRC